MSVENDLSATTPAAVPSGDSAAPATPAAQPEAPAIRVGNSGAHIARAGEEIARQFRAAEETSRSPLSAEDADQETPSGTVADGQTPATAPAAQAPSEMETIRKELAELKREREEAAATKRAAELQSLNQRQMADYEELEADVKAAADKANRDADRLNALNQEYQRATADRDVETMEALQQAYAEQYQDYQISAKAAQRLAQQQEQFKTHNANQYQQARLREQATQIGKIAQKYGLTPDDIKKANAKLDVTNPFDVLESAMAALHSKMTANLSEKEKALKDNDQKVRQEVLAEFDNSPGAQPHPGGSTNTAGGASLGIKVGNSGAMLARAWKTQR